MRLQTLIEHTAELTRIAFSSPIPTDKLISDIFRKKKNYGSKERKFISNSLYFYFRNKLLIDFLSECLVEQYQFNNKFVPAVIVSIAIAKLYPNDFPDYSPIDLLIKLDKNFLFDELLEKDFGIIYNNFIENIIENYLKLNNQISLVKSLHLSEDSIELLEIRYSFPKFILKRILANFNSIEELKKFLENSTKQAPISIRINNLKTTREHIQKQFEQRNIRTEYSEIVPNALKFNQRVQFSELNEYKSGMFEIQDEGSQLISIFLNPVDTDKVLDACSGAGGKSLHIATLQKDKSEIIANDTEFARLMELPKRAHRCGLKSIKINLTVKNSKKSIIKHKYFDKVLVDAPCSGLGTIRRDPVKKYKFTGKILEKLTANQTTILEHYSEFVAPGGILVYSTCSILNDENIDIANNFLANNPNFVPVGVSDIVEKLDLQGKLRLIGPNYISVDFGNTTSDGFFMAKFKRID